MLEDERDHEIVAREDDGVLVRRTEGTSKKVKGEGEREAESCCSGQPSKERTLWPDTGDQAQQGEPSSFTSGEYTRFSSSHFSESNIVNAYSTEPGLCATALTGRFSPDALTV